MKATDILMDEHRVIEQVLNCLEKLADQCAAEKGLDRMSALEALEFFRNVADRCHHGKEEGHLFPLMETAGPPRQEGPTGIMLHEHEEGRQLLASMQAAAVGNAAGEFERLARDYLLLLREHIRTEDQCLFPMAAKILSPMEAELLTHRFEHVESAVMGVDTHEHYLRLANGLADRLGVAHAKVSSGCGCACGHHRK